MCRRLAILKIHQLPAGCHWRYSNTWKSATSVCACLNPDIRNFPITHTPIDYPRSGYCLQVFMLQFSLWNISNRYNTSITMTSWWARLRLKSPASRLLTQSFIQTQIKENIKAPRHWSLCGGFTGERWIPRTKGLLHGKCFHLMTSSWLFAIIWLCFSYLKGKRPVIL